MAIPITIPGERNYIDGLTGIRALAVAWVTLFHLNSMAGPKVIAIHLLSFEIELHPLITIGWIGANVFFVLSGFLLTPHLVERLVSSKDDSAVYRKYFAARIRRVFPAYWVQLVILIVVAVMATHSAPEWIKYLPLHIFMIHNVSFDASWAINPVYWTLPIEFSFYLVLPAVAALLARAEGVSARRGWRALGFIVASSLAISWGYRLLVFHFYEPAGVGAIVWSMNQLPGTIDQFVLGGAAGLAVRWTRGHMAQLPAASAALLSTVLAVLGLSGIVGMIYFIDDIFDIFWIGHWAVFMWYSITAMFIATLLAGIAISSPLTRLLFANRVAVFIGTISYSIYLWHYPIGLWISNRVDMSTTGLGLFLLLALPPIILVSALSYYFVERPFLRMNRLRNPSPQIAKAEGTVA